jgi:hypothetical protein
MPCTNGVVIIRATKTVSNYIAALIPQFIDSISERIRKVLARKEGQTPY